MALEPLCQVGNLSESEPKGQRQVEYSYCEQTNISVLSSFFSKLLSDRYEACRVFMEAKDRGVTVLTTCRGGQAVKLIAKKLIKGIRYLNERLDKQVTYK